MGWLIIAALVWIGVHIGIAGSPLRAKFTARLGEQGFRGAFAALSIVVIGCLIAAYIHTPFIVLWTAPAWLRWLLVIVMLPAFLLFVASLLTRSPTAVGGETALAQQPRGILRITRHPMLWSFALWAAVHVIGNGDLASLIFFGAFLVTALAGMPSIDGKIAARNPVGWERFAAATSIVPFGAIHDDRNQFVAAEIGIVPVVIGVLLWAVLLWAHPHIFGVNALPTG